MSECFPSCLFSLLLHQFDPRPLEEVHAERDALRSPEDLAARDMRDEGRFSYGNQPIRYDRWDAGAPPALDSLLHRCWMWSA